MWLHYCLVHPVVNQCCYFEGVEQCEPHLLGGDVHLFCESELDVRVHLVQTRNGPTQRTFGGGQDRTVGHLADHRGNRD